MPLTQTGVIDATFDAAQDRAISPIFTTRSVFV
jgi:hypothetical protein